MPQVDLLNNLDHKSGQMLFRQPERKMLTSPNNISFLTRKVFPESGLEGSTPAASSRHLLVVAGFDIVAPVTHYSLL